MADILSVGIAQPVLTADRPDQRGVPLDDLIPRLLLAIPRAGHQVGDGRVIVLHNPTMHTGR
jgi:hypothetical protein